MTYGELKTAVLERAHRTDLNASVFIANAHSKIVNDLDVSSMRKFAILDTTGSTNISGSVWSTPLPADTLKVLSVLANNTEIEYRDAAALQAITQADSGVAQFYSIVGKDLWTAPGVAGQLGLHYYERMANLVNDTDTNEVLTNYSAIYLYGALVELHNSTQDTEQMSIAGELYNAHLGVARDQMLTLNTGGLPRMR